MELILTYIIDQFSKMGRLKYVTIAENSVKFLH